MNTTRQAVACEWCSTPGAEIGSASLGMCPACLAAQTIARRYLENIGKLSSATMEEAKRRYLASRPRDADLPARPEPEPFNKCPNCGAEPVIGLAWECWQCGYEVTR